MERCFGLDESQIEMEGTSSAAWMTFPQLPSAINVDLASALGLVILNEPWLVGWFIGWLKQFQTQM